MKSRCTHSQGSSRHLRSKSANASRSSLQTEKKTCERRRRKTWHFLKTKTKSRLETLVSDVGVLSVCWFLKKKRARDGSLSPVLEIGSRLWNREILNDSLDSESRRSRATRGGPRAFAAATATSRPRPRQTARLRTARTNRRSPARAAPPSRAYPRETRDSYLDSFQN